MIWLMVLFVSLAQFTGCVKIPGQATPKIVSKIDVRICPPGLPDVECNQIDEPEPKTLRDLFQSYGSIYLEYSKCLAAHKAFVEAYEGCSSVKEKE